jgi:peptidyl-prolyl cis-trans isomerase SurA
LGPDFRAANRNIDPVKRNIFKHISLRTGLAAGLIALAAGGVQAQDVTPGAQGAIAIPENLTIFAANDPNVRKASVVVNGEVITGTDVDQRLALILAANEGQIAPEEVQRLRLQVLRNLMDETLQIQAAKEQEMEVDEAEVDQSYARVAQQNFGGDAKQLDGYLARIGSSATSLKRQIRGELSWQRLLRRNVTPFVNVSDEEVNEVIVRLKAARGSDEYRVGEIFLSANEENKVAVFANGNKIMEQLKGGGNFTAYARQFSEASTASVGGDLGWVRMGILPAEMDNVLRQMQPGQLVGPIEIRGGFTIIYLIDKRQVLTADPRDAVLSLKQISIAFAPGTTEAQAQARAEQMATVINGARGCQGVDAAAATIGADVVANEQLKARDLPPALQQLLLGLTPGQATPPFGSIQDGVRMLMLCGRDDPALAGEPDAEQVQAQIEDERINKRGLMYLRDLRRDAVIDYN